MKKKFIACLGMIGLVLTSFFASPINSDAYSNHVSHTSTSYKDITTDLSLGTLNASNSTIGCFDSNYVIPKYEIFAFYNSEFNSFYSWDSSLKQFWREWEGEITFDSSYYTVNTMGNYNCCTSGTFKDHSARFSPNLCKFGYFITDFKFKGSIHGIDLRVSFEPDKTSPTVTGTNLFSTNVDSLPTQDEILSHISVTDDVDDAPKLQVVSSTYDATNKKLGDFNIVVRGVDASGNVSPNYTITIRVVDTTAPIIRGTNIDSQPNNVKLSEDQIKAQFSVSDNYYGSDDITLTLTRNDYSSNWNKPGSFLVECKATDASGNTSSSATISIIVKDRTNPTVTGTNIENQPNITQLSEAQILAQFNASDDVAIKSKTLIRNEYSSNWKKPGSYTVECEVFDTASNRATTTITITVIDAQPPVVEGSTIERVYNSKLEDLKSLFTYSDDVTPTEDIAFEIIEDNYTANFNQKGSYTIKARFSDTANNGIIVTSTINVVDNIKPVITAPTLITVGNNLLLTDTELREKISVVDGYDGTITNYTLSDESNYKENYKTPGSYSRIITATDASGNTQSITITITVSDTTSPEVWFDEFFIVLQEGESLTTEELTSYAVQTLSISVEDIVSIDGQYDTNTPGEYPLAVNLMNGEAETLTLLVTEQAEDKDPADEDSKPENKFWSFDEYADNIFNFGNWKNWTFWIWATWIGIGFVGIVVIGLIVRKKK